MLHAALAAWQGQAAREAKLQAQLRGALARWQNRALTAAFVALAMNAEQRRNACTVGASTIWT